MEEAEGESYTSKLWGGDALHDQINSLGEGNDFMPPPHHKVIWKCLRDDAAGFGATDGPFPESGLQLIQSLQSTLLCNAASGRGSTVTRGKRLLAITIVHVKKNKIKSISDVTTGAEHLQQWRSNFLTTRCIINPEGEYVTSFVHNQRVQHVPFHEDVTSALTWNRSYTWPGPSCDTGTRCLPPAAPHQSVISVRKKTWAAPAGRQRSPCWPACAR